MKSLTNYIFESIEVSTTSNKQRKKELEKWLKHKKYDDYVNTLNKMLNDPKAATLLEDGFGGELGDTKLVFSIKEIPVSQLIPTQSEIILEKSLKHALSNKDSFIKTFNEIIDINKPIITFRQNYIIDGHHTWFQSIVLNPEGKIKAFNYDGDISPIQMLKAVQGTIAAVKAEKNNNNGELPSNNSKGINIFDKDFNKEKIKKYLKENINDDIIKIFSKYVKKCVNLDAIIDWIIERILDIKSNNYPIESSPSRNKMPQLYKGGTDYNDKTSAYPDKEGSAMNKLKDDNFYKQAIK